MAASQAKDKKKATKGKEDLLELLPEEMSDEDVRLQADLTLLVIRAQDSDAGVREAAVKALCDAVKGATGSMTSVPKPLKFLTAHYATLVAAHEKNPLPTLADLISWLGMTLGAEKRDALRYKLLGTKESIPSWGHEFVRHLALEIGIAHNEDETERPEGATVLTPEQETQLLDELVPYLMEHNAEHEAVDLLLEVEQLPRLLPLIQESNVARVALYLLSCAHYLPEGEDLQALRIVLEAYAKTGRVPEQLRLALALGDEAAVKSVYESASGPMKAQLALILGAHGHYSLIESETDDDLQALIGNTKRSQWFQGILAKDLDVLEPKLPEEIYKEDITGDKKKKATTAAAPAKTDSARNNLASTFVNAFVNAGFSKDKLLTEGAQGGEWLFKNREHGRITAAASVGLVCLWDPDLGSNEVDKFSYTKDEFVKAGVMIGTGLFNVHVRSSYNVAFSLIAEQLKDPSTIVQQSTAFALGLAYAGSGVATDIRDVLVAAFDETQNTEQQAHIALALGMTHIGTCDADLSELLLTALIEKGEAGLDSPFTRHIALAIGLLFLGKQERAQVTLETLKVLPGAWGRYAVLTLDTCAYAGSGNVLKIQQLLSVCGEKPEEAAAFPLAVAVLGLPLIAMREEIGRQMVVRSFEHLLQYSEPPVRRAVPLALAFLHISDPDVSVMDTLSKFSHDHDAEVAMAATLGLGLIGAGTNHARIAGLLRALATYYAKEAGQLFVVRLAQGLLHLGKGTMTLRPFHSDGLLLRPAALAGLLVALHTSLDMKGLVLGKAHYLLYALATAMAPRWLITLDEQLEPLPVTVRVGQAVDVVGKAGTPKTITGFQTHTTPVLMNANDRAELATDEWLPLTPIVEGVVILKPNPNAKPKKKD